MFTLQINKVMKIRVTSQSLKLILGYTGINLALSQVKSFGKNLYDKYSLTLCSKILVFK